jgi:hypothetical protein
MDSMKNTNAELENRTPFQLAKAGSLDKSQVILFISLILHELVVNYVQSPISDNFECIL